LSAMEHPAPDFRVMNVGTGEETTILEIAEAFGGEIKHIEPRIEPRRSCANANLVKKNLDWQPNKSIISWINEIK
jgi:nucleoside-diphosphate-sugar epimerase